jgi:hypothetical protein
MGHARYRVGLHGRTFVDYREAFLEAKQRGRRLHLVVGTRAVLQLPDTFTLTERIGALVYVCHAYRGHLHKGAGYPHGHLGPDDPWIRVDHNRLEVTATRCVLEPRQEATP